MERQIERFEKIPERLAAIETAAEATRQMVARLVERLLHEPRSFDQRDPDRRR